MRTFLEQLQDYAKNFAEINPSRKLLLEDPAKFFSTQVEALTEDLDKKAFGNPLARGSKAYIVRSVLENQAKFLYEQMLMESTTTALPSGQSFTFTTVALPLVRKVFDALIAMSLVSVQPITQPTAKIFYLDFQYHDAPSGGSAGDSVFTKKDKGYSTSAESGAVKEIDLKVTDETITAIQKKLKAIWTMELEQDLMAYQGLSVENELMGVLQEQITREVDALLLYALYLGAGGTGTGIGTGAGNVNWSKTPLAGDTTSTYIKDYKRTIYEAITDADNLIFKKRYRYATWIIGHPDAINRLEKLEEFTTVRGAGQAGTIESGRHLTGTLGGRYDVWKDPFWAEYADADVMLMGYKGTNWMETVGFYAPYIPLYMTPKIIDTNDFTPRRGLMSRFAYGTLIKDGLATVTLTES